MNTEALIRDLDALIAERDSYKAALEEARQEYRRRWLVVHEDGEHVAYNRGLRGSWDEWRAVQMMRDANPDRVGTRPIRDDVAAHTDTFPEEWCNE